MLELNTCGDETIHQPHTFTCPGVTFKNTKFTARELESSVDEALGGTKEQPDEYYYEEYTGLNQFYHALAGNSHTGYHQEDDTNFMKVQDSPLILDVPGVGEFKQVEVISEYNESGDLDYKLVFEFGGRTFMKEGALDSWSGGYWDGSIREVKAVEKKITVWE